MKHLVRATVITRSTYVRVYREEGYVLVQYATYLCTSKTLRRTFFILRAAYLGDLNQGTFVILRAAHLRELNQ